MKKKRKKFKKCFYFCVYGRFVCVCVYAMCMPGTSEGQKRVLDLLGLELQL